MSTPDAMRALAARLPDATLAVHDDWGHLSPFVDPVGLGGILRAAAAR